MPTRGIAWCQAAPGIILHIGIIGFHGAFHCNAGKVILQLCLAWHGLGLGDGFCVGNPIESPQLSVLVANILGELGNHLQRSDRRKKSF